MEIKNYFATDAAGNILPSATCYVYKAGTTDFATGITNINGAALPNPFTAQPSGLVQFAAPDGNYDLRVTKSGRDFTIRIQSFDGMEFKSYVDNEFSKPEYHEINALDFGADNTGVSDCSEALSDMWSFLRSTLNTTSYLSSYKLVIPPGTYIIENTVDWSAAWAWNLKIICSGAVFIGRTQGKPVFDMTQVRGAQSEGMSIYGDPEYIPSTGVLLGPSVTGGACGNNEFKGFTTEGCFSVAPAWNMGSETTKWDRCYFINRQDTKNCYSFVGDAMNRLGASSDFTQTRQPMTWASLTNNTFEACRFANHRGGDGVYLEGQFGWWFDFGCYHLSFGGSNFVLRMNDNFYRMTNLRIEGLFETAGPTMFGGLKDCVRIVADEGLQVDIQGFYLNTGSPHASRSIIRVERPDGQELSNPSRIKLVNAEIIVDRTLNVQTVTPLFSGQKLMVQGDIKCRQSAMVNLDKLEGFQGNLYTNDYSLVTRPTEDKPFSFMVFEEVGNSGRAVRVGGVSNSVVINPGSVPRIFPGGTNTNLRINGVGTGGVLIGRDAKISDESFGVEGSIAATADVRAFSGVFSGPTQIGGYTLANIAAGIPSASQYVRHMIIVTNATGGPALCRSNGTNWIDLHTKQAVA